MTLQETPQSQIGDRHWRLVAIILALKKLCYTGAMQNLNPEWIRWAESLRRWELQGLVTWLMDMAGPVRLIGAQVLYFSQPFLGGRQALALAEMLEDEGQASAFAAFLREGSNR